MDRFLPILTSTLVLITPACDDSSGAGTNQNSTRTRRPPPDAQQQDAAPRAINLASLTVGMVRVPTSRFRSACNWPQDPSCRRGEFEIELPEFYIDRTEVTVEQYARCVDAKRCAPPSPNKFCKPSVLNWDKPDRRDHPVNCVNTDQAASYCAFRGAHLPTAHQFERAARGHDSRKFPWGDADPTCETANLAYWETKASCGHATWPVGSRPKGASPEGAFDLVGNVAEFVTFSSRPFDPLDLVGRDAVIVMAMGGGFTNGESHRVDAMQSGGDATPLPDDGFRCAFTPALAW